MPLDRFTSRAILLAALFSAATSEAGAQSRPRSIDGRVIRATDGDPRPVPGTWVVLHRVAPDTAGPLDSMRTRANGGYRFDYRATGDTNALYFVSTNRGGVAYFTPPTRELAVRGDAAELLVFDTTSAAIPIRPQGRHIIVTAPDSGKLRTVIEVYEISNDTSVTRVARGEGATFDAPLPRGVSVISGGQGDISADAIRARGGRAEVTAPLAPGLRRLSFYYDVPVSTAPLELLVASPLPVLEVLIEDPAGLATGAGLVAVDPVNVEGRPFRRFLAKDVAAAQGLSITVPVPGAARQLRLMLVITAVGAAMLLGLGAAFMRGGLGAFARPRITDPETLALEIAALDSRFESIGAPTEEQRAEHFVARAQLKGRLSDALAKRDGLA